MSDKKRNKNPFLYFRIDEVNRMKTLDPPITKRQDVNPVISEGWAKIKNDNGDVYKHYLELASGTHEQPGEKQIPNSSLREPEYQTTKPFHKFSLNKRKELEVKYGDNNAVQITKRLIGLWDSLTKSEKCKWKI